MDPELESGSVFVDADNPTFEEVSQQWQNHFVLILLVILLCRFAAFLLPLYLPTLLANIIPSARAKRAKHHQLLTEITAMKQQMENLSMVDNFAQYSKLERKHNTLKREKLSYEQSRIGTTLISKVALKVMAYLVEGIFLAWVVFQSPTATVDVTDLSRITPTTSYLVWVGWLVHALHHLPHWLLTSAWIALCEAAVAAAVSYFCRRFFS